MPSDDNFTPVSPDVTSDTYADAKTPKPSQAMVTDEEEEESLEKGETPRKRYTGDRVTNFVESSGVELKS